MVDVSKVSNPSVTLSSKHPAKRLGAVSSFGALAYFAEFTTGNHFPKLEARWFTHPLATPDTILMHNVNGDSFAYRTVPMDEPLAAALTDLDTHINTVDGYKNPDVFKQDPESHTSQQYVKGRTRVFKELLGFFGGHEVLAYKSHKFNGPDAEANYNQTFDYLFGRPYREGKDFSLPKLMLDALGHDTNPPFRKTNRNALMDRPGGKFVINDQGLRDLADDEAAADSSEPSS